jgi:hypothetical protein
VDGDVKVRKNPHPSPLPTCGGLRQQGDGANTGGSRNSLQQEKGEWVTFWKNILSLFGEVGINHFEGGGLLSKLENGWILVRRVCKI